MTRPCDTGYGPRTTRRDAYVAVRFPPGHVLFHILWDDATKYDEIKNRVVASVREALDEMGVHVIETSEEPIV